MSPEWLLADALPSISLTDLGLPCSPKRDCWPGCSEGLGPVWARWAVIVALVITEQDATYS